MKKILLTFAAALVVAMSANAQVERVSKSVKGLAPEKGCQMENVAKIDGKTMKANRAKKVTRRADTTIYGEYILDANEGEFVANTTFSIEEGTGTIKLDQYDGEPDFEYNVILKGFTYDRAVAYGKYYEEDGFIQIPVQTIYTHDTYKEIVLSGGYPTTDGYVHYGREIYLIDNGDGTLDIDADDKDEEGQEREATTGWVSFLPNYEEGGLWNTGFDIFAMKPNAIMSCWVSGYLRNDGQTSGWQEDRLQIPVYAESWETEYVIHNFMNMASVSVTLEEGGSCFIPLPQYMDSYDYGDPYGMMRLVAIQIDEEGHLIRDYNIDSYYGKIYNTENNLSTVMDFFEFDEEGYVNQDLEQKPYLYVSSGGDDQGRAYNMGAMQAIRIEIPNPEVIEGIATVNTSKQNTKTFNLMGQQVSRANVKGIVIRDGKKLMVK